jgi:hypothetical protein
MRFLHHPCLTVAGLAGALLCSSFAGCASVANFTAMRSIPVAGSKNPVIDLASIWQQGEGRDDRGRPCRGFCGQLMFLTAASKKPAVVNGAVSIYVFDNVGTMEEQAKPFQVFEFKAEEWASFQRLTNLGMTYQLFIPYTRPGGHEVDCQLYVRYTPTEGGLPIQSHPETISLRGSSKAAALASSIDQKLMSSSPVYGRTGLSHGLQGNAPSSAAVNELLLKMQADRSQATPLGPSAKQADLPPATRQTELDRLQAVLEASASERVQPASHRDASIDRRRVSQAVYEEVDSK